MGYIHRTGGTHDLGGKETEYGKDLAEEFGEKLSQAEKKNKEIADMNYKEAVKKWAEESKKIEHENQRRKKEYEKNRENWKNECERLCKEYEKKLKIWEEDCSKSIFGFIKKILKINKPKINLPEGPKQPLYSEPKPKPEFGNMWKWV